MTLYQFSCSSCEIEWDKKGSMSKPPRKDSCPECGEKRDRVFTAPGLSFRGTGWMTNQSRGEKFARDGYDKQEAHEFYRTAMRDSKKRMESGEQHYTPMKPNYEVLEKQKLVKKIDNQKLKEKRKEQHKKLTGEWHDKTKLDPTKPTQGM